MRSYNYMTLFAGAVLAQESATVINFFQRQATTFQNSCPSDAAGISAVPSDLLPTPDDASATPAPTPAPRMRRQASASDDDYIFCEPYTIVQGPETYEFHLTDPVPGAWTVDMKCSWKGEMTKADLTCDVTQSGRIPDQSSEIQDMQAYQVVSLVSASGAASPASASASVTPTPTATRAPSASGSKAPASSDLMLASTPSQGFAPAGPCLRAL
ncbi:hypothetical protein J3E71DRAFT_336294 [Bipolaris maydis]|nr:hypothetical protein J3E71DRAFT_336294 [Bipolaris maydis]